MLRLYTLEVAVSGGRGVAGADCDCDCASLASFGSCNSRDGSEALVTDGGVRDPDVGDAPLPPASLELSVECSVRKLALDRRLSPLKLKRDGAMAGSWPSLSGARFCFLGGVVGVSSGSPRARVVLGGFGRGLGA